MITMAPAPQIPSHLRYLIAGVQERAMDLALQGRMAVRAEFSAAAGYAVFELVTHPDGTTHRHPDYTRITADLNEIVHPGITEQPLETALADARASLGAMLDHIEAELQQGLSS